MCECLFDLIKMPGYCKFNDNWSYNDNYKDRLSKVPGDPYVDSTLTIIMSELLFNHSYCNSLHITH